MRCKQVATKAVATLFSLAASASAAENDVPAWHRADPGSYALLGDDGGGVETATVCSNADGYRRWLDSVKSQTCKSFERGLRVLIQEIIFDPKLDALKYGSDYVGTQLAKVTITSKKFTGFLGLNVLHPIIPIGTVVRLGGKNIELYDAEYKNGVGLEEHTAAKLLSYNPSTRWQLSARNNY